jgi:hypothetical protein
MRAGKRTAGWFSTNSKPMNDSATQSRLASTCFLGCYVAAGRSGLGAAYGKNTYKQNIYYLLLFNCNNGYVKAVNVTF